MNIDDFLQKLVNSITMTDNAPKMVNVKYFSRCLDKKGELKERQECGGLRVSDVVEFEVVLQVYTYTRAYFDKSDKFIRDVRRANCFDSRSIKCSRWS